MNPDRERRIDVYYWSRLTSYPYMEIPMSLELSRRSPRLWLVTWVDGDLRNLYHTEHRTLKSARAEFANLMVRAKKQEKDKEDVLSKQ